MRNWQRAVLTSSAGSSEPALSSPSFANQNTTITNNLGADGYTWAQALPISVDGSGKILSLAQNYTVGHSFVYSNNGGSTWNDNALNETALQRGAVALDTVNDVAHVLWSANDAGDGIIYRRYTISRSGGNITGLTKDAGVNLQLDYQVSGSYAFAHPIMIFLSDAAFGTYGALLAIWSVQRLSSAGNEIRASMVTLGSTADAGKTAGNWAAPVSASTTTIGNAPQVAYSALVANATAAGCRPSALRTASGAHAKDVYLGYYDGNTASNGGAWQIKRMQWASGSNNWSTGLSAAVKISDLKRAGTDTGYDSKGELGSQLAHDTTNDQVGFAFPTWKDNTSGDTITLGLCDSADAVSSTDVYSAAGTHSYAPTCDLVWDSTARRFVVSYIATSTQAAYVRLYNGSTATGAATLIYSALPVDIPLLYSRLSGKLLVLFRDTTNSPTPPYHGVFGTVTWS